MGLKDIYNPEHEQADVDDFRILTHHNLREQAKLRNQEEIPRQHVFTVVNLMLEEMISDLIQNIKINIVGLGELFVKTNSARKHYNVWHGGLIFSKGSKSLKFKIDKNLKKALISYLHLDKTFKAD